MWEMFYKGTENQERLELEMLSLSERKSQYHT